MTGKSHFGIGIITTAILSEYLKYNLNTATLIVCTVASLLPDIDHPKGFINQYLLPIKSREIKIALYVVIGIFIILLDYFYFNMAYLKVIGIFFILIGISTHRDGITHSLTGLLCFAGVLGFVANTYNFKEVIFPFIIGYGMHLLCDMLTSKGVPLFYPFNKKKYKFPVTFTVGSWWGNLIEGGIIASGLLYLVFKLPVIITKIR
jgi:inner membrane protein